MGHMNLLKIHFQIHFWGLHMDLRSVAFGQGLQSRDQEDIIKILLLALGIAHALFRVFFNYFEKCVYFDSAIEAAR